MDKLSLFVDHVSEFFAHRKGLLPLIGIGLVVLNFIFQLVPAGWLTQTNCFLHLGILIGFIGFMVARAL